MVLAYADACLLSSGHQRCIRPLALRPRILPIGVAFALAATAAALTRTLAGPPPPHRIAGNRPRSTPPRQPSCCLASFSDPSNVCWHIGQVEW